MFTEAMQGYFGFLLMCGGIQFPSADERQGLPLWSNASAFVNHGNKGEFQSQTDHLPKSAWTELLLDMARIQQLSRVHAQIQADGNSFFENSRLQLACNTTTEGDFIQVDPVPS